MGGTWTKLTRKRDVPFGRPALNVAVSAAILGIGAFVLEQLDYRHSVRDLPTSLYLVILAVGFTFLGAVVALFAVPRRSGRAFERNERAIKSLKLTEREIDILERLALGESNKEIARAFDVSPNTIKTQLSSAYRKLGARSRMEAAALAREYGIVA